MFGIGPAGTGKTYLAMAVAVQALIAKQVNRLILTRPAVEAGEKLGFLPGTLSEKIDPYLRPLYDALYEMIDAEQIGRMMERERSKWPPGVYAWPGQPRDQTPRRVPPDRGVRWGPGDCPRIPTTSVLGVPAGPQRGLPVRTRTVPQPCAAESTCGRGHRDDRRRGNPLRGLETADAGQLRAGTTTGSSCP